MGTAKTLEPLFADIRRRARRRRAATADTAPLVLRLLAACELRAIEERANGFAFRFGEAAGELVTVFVHHAAGARGLTAAEADVADALCAGRTRAQIAQARGVSTNTVKSQVRQIFRKLNVESRVMLARRLFP